MNADKWLTLDELAEYLKLGRTKLYLLAQKGKIPASKVGSQWRFERREVDKWIEGNGPSYELKKIRSDLVLKEVGACPAPTLVGRADIRMGTSKRKSPTGVATNDLVFSAHVGTNDEVFPQVISLYVPKGSIVADVTYGQGVFWKRVPQGAYKLMATDLSTGIDCRVLPYDDGSVDCVVFDPPYMHSPGGTAHVNHQNYEVYYKNNQADSTSKYHEAVLDLYFKAAEEAWRVLRQGGVYIVKCQDEVCANRQRLTHVELINDLAAKGFVAEDMYVVVRNGKPGVSRILRQAHSRKNHSYFLVFLKPKGRARWTGLDRCMRVEGTSPKRIAINSPSDQAEMIFQ